MKRSLIDTMEKRDDHPLPPFDSPRPTPSDRERLGRQKAAVLAFALGRGWLTLRQVSEGTGAPEASAPARLRDLRKDGYTVERRNEGRGLFLYRVTGAAR